MKLNYKKYGEGRSMIVLHGLFGMLDNWKTFARHMEGFEVFLVDQRNHGKSPRSDDFSYPLLAMDILEFLDDHDLKSVILLGHSMGGKAAIQMAHDYPDRISQLIIVDITTKYYPPGHTEIFDAVLGLDLEMIKSRREADDALSKHINNLGVRQFLLKNLSRQSEGGFKWKANFKSLKENYDSILSAIDIRNSVQVETLFIRGSKSDYIRIEDDKLLSSEFSNFKIKTIEAGHWVHAEKLEEMVQVVEDFCHHPLHLERKL